MDLQPIRDASPPPAPVADPGVASRPVVPGSTRSLEAAVDPADFERRLLELALDASGAGAACAWMLMPADSGRLVIVREISTFPAGRPAGERGGEIVESHSEWDPLASGEAIAAAWRDGRVAWSNQREGDTPWSSFGAVGAIRLRLDREGDRVLVAGWVPGTPEARERFESLAEHARLAARALEAREGRRVAEDQRAALVDWLRAAASSHHVSEGLRAAARAALRVSGSQVAAVWTHAAGRPPGLAHTAGETRERESIARALQAWANDVMERATPKVVEPASEAAGAGEADPALWPLALERVRRARFFPLIASGQVLGVLAVADLTSRRRPSHRTLESESTPLLVAVADGLAMLLDRAAAAEARRAGEQKQRELQERLRRRDRFAATAERAAAALADIRQPMGSIAAFARRAHREMAEDDPRREYLEVILRESERIERRIAEIAAAEEPAPARLAMETLNAVLQDVLPCIGEQLVRRRVRLLKRLDPESPALLLDGERIRQVFRNVLERAVESVPVGGRVRVESRLVRDHVIAEIAFDGGRSPGDLLEELFVPFTPEAAHGAPGLGVADRVIRQHGGEVRVRADGEWGAAVLITLPVRGNEERRRSREDRRGARTDRRAAAPR